MNNIFGRNKVTLFIAGLLIVLVSGLIYFQFDNSLDSTELVQSLATVKKKSFDRIFELKNLPLKNLVNDYSSWNEMVAFVQKEDKKWAIDNLDTINQKFTIDSLWVYNQENKMVYSKFFSDIEKNNSNEIPIPKSQMDEMFNSSAVSEIFIQTPSGVMEIFGNVITATNDTEKIGDRSGYYFVGRFLDDEYFSSINSILDSKISLVESIGDSNEVINMESGVYTFYEPLSDQNNTIVTYLKIDTVLPLVKEYFNSSRINTIIIFSAYSLSLLLLIFLIYSMNSTNKRVNELARNITKNLLQSEEKFKAINDASPLGVFVADKDGNCTYANEKYFYISDLTSDECKEKGWQNSILEEDKLKLTKEFQSIIHNKTIANIDIRFKHKNDNVIWANVRASVIINEKGEESGFVGTIEDITERKNAEDELKKRNQELEQLNKLMLGRELKMIDMKKEIEKIDKND
ncbi:MAG: PAS domain S-box protein [bacterium]